MTIDTNQFWSLLTESQLVNVPQVQALFMEFTSAGPKEKDTQSLANWLVKKKAISSYHAQILVAGHNGPFRYGNYLVIDQVKKNAPQAETQNENSDESEFLDHFVAQHSKTGHPALLQFMPGTESKHLDRWRQIEAMVETLSTVQHPNVLETYEAVVLKSHRFVVSQYSTAKTLGEKFPRKVRAPWKKACQFAAQIANGLEQLHAANICFQSLSNKPLSLDNIHLDKSSLVQIRCELISDSNSNLSNLSYQAPEVSANNELDPSADVYSLGSILLRMISGRELASGQTPDLSKYELPGELDSLIKKMIDPSPEQRPSVTEASNLLGLLSGKASELKALKLPASKTRDAFRNSVRQFLPGADLQSISAVPEIGDGLNSGPVTPVERSEERQAKISAATAAALSRKKGRWKIPAAIAGSLIALASAIGIFALRANNTVVAEREETSTTKTTEPADTETLKKVDPEKEILALPLELRPTLMQNVIADNQTSLWESPTNGAPNDFSYLPPNPKLLFTFRLSEMDADDEGQRLLKSLGPEFEARIAQFKNQSGLDFENIKILTVSLHANDALEYEPYFIVETSQPIEADLMAGYWNRPASKRLENQEEIFESNDGSLAYYILERESLNAPAATASEADPNAAEPDNADGAPKESTKITRFAFGEKSLIEQVAISAGTIVLGGPMRKISQWTDRERHVNILYLRPGLFNDEGQSLMGERNLSLNRELSVMLPDEVKGGLVSLHLSEGSYFEMMFDRSLDLKATDLQKELTNSFKSQRDSLAQFVATIPPSPYWDKVRSRYYSMLSQFYRYLRWNIEHGEIAANCWLPPMAAHNLIASSELVMTFASGASTIAAPIKSGPKTIEELLALKRDLNIANPPDLNVLMADLQTEISDDFGKLPFAFNIRLIGGDLEKDGITKNQRPPEIVMNQKSLGEILTSIMTGANPDKDITGPSDPNCKLIWVLADDPENPGQKAILITTRAAAAAKSYELPAAFRTQ